MPSRRQPSKNASRPKSGAILFAGIGILVFAGIAFALRTTSLDPARKLPPNETAAAPAPEAPPGTNEVVEIDIDKATDHLLRGNEALSAGKLDDAIREFRLSAKYNPEDEDVYYNLALTLAQKGDVAGAKTHYAKSLELFPDYVEAHNNLGNILAREGDFDAAIKHFQTALANDPENASAHNNLGNALARQKKTPESINHFEEAVRLKPDYAEAQFNLGNAYLIVGRAEEAAKQFTLLLNMHPNFPRVREQLQKARALAQNQASK